MPDARTTEQARIRALGRPPEERSDQPFAGAFESGYDLKAWNRASIALNSRPLHPFPAVSQEDFILPSGADRLRLIGDCAVFGTCVSGLSFFPLWMMDLLADGAWANWVWGSMAAIWVASALFLFVYAPVADRKYLQKLLG